MTISQPWVSAIESFLLAQRSAGVRPSSIYARRQHLQHLARRVDTGPWTLTALELVEYAGGQSWAPETRRGRRQTFHAFWTWAIANDLTESNPAAALTRIKATAPNPQPVPLDVLERAYARADGRLALILRLAAEAGMRRAEIAVVHSDDLFQDLDGWSLVVHGKGGKRRTVPLTRRLALELRALPAGYAFPGDEAGHLSPRWVGKIATTVLDGDWTLHKLRHLAATRWYEQAGDIAVPQELLGHASPATTLRYARKPAGRLRGVVDAAAS